jgi:hypothetical protein
MKTTDNLELWHKVEKTNPKYTKNANVKGNRITSIAPQYQIMNVTEQFGIYGKEWGFKDLKIDYTLANTLGLAVLNATFFFPNGEFPIINSISLFMDNAKTKIDDNFAKKLETDALTKAISKLGFNADIFMGKFDDQRYVNEINAEFGNTTPQPTVTPTPQPKATPTQLPPFGKTAADKHIPLKTPLAELKKHYTLTTEQETKYLNSIK